MSLRIAAAALVAAAGRRSVRRPVAGDRAVGRRRTIARAGLRPAAVGRGPRPGCAELFRRPSVPAARWPPSCCCRSVACCPVIAVVPAAAARPGAGRSRTRPAEPRSPDPARRRAATSWRLLGRAIDEMMDRIAAGYEGQRRFAANASHELRTPAGGAADTDRGRHGQPLTDEQFELLTAQLLRDQRAQRAPDRGAAGAQRERPGPRVRARRSGSTQIAAGGRSPRTGTGPRRPG